MLTPILTEKSLADAKDGKYTFWVDMKLNKFQIKHLVNAAFGVHVTGIRIIKKQSVVAKKNRRSIVASPKKKAIVTLKEKEKIDLFEEVKK